MVFAHDHQGHIHDPLPKLQPARGGDKSLMEMFLEGPYSYVRRASQAYCMAPVLRHYVCI
jgi:hypothetical protein